jgi:PmbA protein
LEHALDTDALDAVVEQALSEGARAAEVLVVRGHTHRVAVAADETAPHHDDEPIDTVTVRVWVDGGRVGKMVGQWDERNELVGQALARTFESAESDVAGPMPSIGGLQSGLGTDDRRYVHLDREARQEVVTDTLDQIADAAVDEGAGFSAAGVRYRDQRTWRGLSNSRGLSLSEWATEYRVDGMVSGHGLVLQDHLAARSFASIASLPLGTQLVRRGIELLEDGDTLPAGPVRVVLPPRPMARILAVLGEHFHPDRLVSDAFFLYPSENDVPTLSEKLHVVDDGSQTAGLRTRMFDDRGVPPVPLTLIREGRIDARFLDPEAARQLDTRPTGHCWGEGLGPSNLLMRHGTRSLNALLTEIGGPSLMVDDLDPASIDVKSGAIDCLVDGRVMEANQFTGAMRRVRLHGNLLDLLSNVVDIGNDTDRIGHVDAAGLIADGLFLDV